MPRPMATRFLQQRVESNPAPYSKLPYDTAKDFVEVGLFGVFSYVVVVRKDGPYRSISDLIDAAKAKPGKISSGHSGSSSQVPLELLKSKAGVDFITASYRGAPHVVNDVAASVIDFAILAAVSGVQRSPAAYRRNFRNPRAKTPEIPAVAEKVPGFIYEGWLGLSAPARTPRQSWNA